MCFLLVGKHTNFCCHLRRGNTKPDGPTYEYAKFIMSVQDFFNGKQFSF